MFARNVGCVNCQALRRYSASLLEKKIARNKRRKEKELKQIKQLESEGKQKKAITTELSNVAYNLDTLPGQKKDVTCPLPATYSSKFVEACWYEWWESEGYFQPKRKNEKSGKFSMVIPPPNVTGKLHLGHALTVALEDVLCRWNRMKGDEVVWIPGCDHAGIATQAVVEKLLQMKNVTRHELGRDEFINEVWKWKDIKEEEIYDQLRVLGASLDWTRTNFTLDPKFSKAVREAFIRLHSKGIIYRSKSLVNWSCQLQSTISDIEVENRSLPGPTMVSVPGYKKKIEFGTIHTFAYPLVTPTSEQNSISVSTTRIETMLGDKAVAVHPDDQRYASHIGTRLRHPLLADVTLPVIGDSSVSKDFGTGAVKITPGHDYNDFEIGKRHNLPLFDILDDSGNISNTGNTAFDNVPRFIAREKVIEALSEVGLYKGKEPHEMSLPVCSRSGDVVEPRIKTQWFVSIRELAQRAIEAVKTGQIQLEPESHTSAWNTWLTETGDWCISRQLWWGHRIPAYRVTNNKGESHWVSAHTEEEAREKAQCVLSENDDFTLTQDEDVLDTWFSSALFPFATLGWPNVTEDLKRYYPLSVMETGYDLLFFWVARMVMMGLALTDQVPFKTVYLHTMVRDSQGRKMSKSLGNVIDPLQVIHGSSPEELDGRIKESSLSQKEEKYALRDRAKTLPQGIPECGTDALRFSLCMNKNTGKDISLDVHSVVQYRYFCNKIWNAFKFLCINVEKNNEYTKNKNDLRPVDLWILSRLSDVVSTVNTALDELNFSVAAGSLHKFFLHDFADFYLESCKYVFTESNCESTQGITVGRNFEFVFNSFLRLLSPFMPYLAEELWQRLPNRNDAAPSIMEADYLGIETSDFRNSTLEGSIANMRNVIQVIRNMKQVYRVSSNSAEITISCWDIHEFSDLLANSEVIKHLAKCSSLTVLPQNVHILSGCISNDVSDNVKVFIKLQGVVNVMSQLEQLEKKKLDLEKTIFELNINKTELSASKLKKIENKVTKSQQSLSDVEKLITTLRDMR